MRLNVYLARALGISRRQADKEIEQGRVSVDGRPVSVGTIVDPRHAGVTYKKKKLHLPQRYTTIALYKPRGYVTTRTDPQKRKTVMDLLPQELRALKPVGRLDYDSEGLLLLTDNGELIQQWTHPKFEHQKEYIVTFRDSVTDTLLRRFTEGIPFPEGVAKAGRIKRLSTHKLVVVLHQGFNRQLRRMAEACGNSIVKLVRVRSGDICLGDLKPGQWREV